jgi:platelet-activating factor acetylhydrolase
VTEGAGKTIIERCLTDEKVLESALLEDIPDTQKPDDEFIAAKLKVSHEFRTRLAARIQRKLKRAKKHGFYKPGDEVWMHFKPEPESLRKQRHSASQKQHTGTGGVDECNGEDTGKPTDSAEDTDTQSGPGDTSSESWLGFPPSLQT